MEVMHTEKMHGVAGYADPKQMANNQKAACHITVEDSRTSWHGSGSLVDGRVFGFPRICILTNQHVLPAIEAARAAVVRFNYEDADSRGWIEVSLDPDLGFICHEDRDLDFCLVACSDQEDDSGNLAQTLSKAHKTQFAAALQLDESAVAEVGMPITIWQHPRGGFKVMSSWTLDVVTTTQLKYKNDTEPGSSGSPIFNNMGQLIGVHYAGDDGSNYGCRLSAIMHYIRTNSDLVHRTRSAHL